MELDKSGSLSHAELKAALKRPGGGIPLSDEEVAEIISEFDTNQDGELQFDEFAAFWEGGTSAKEPPASAEAAQSEARQQV